MLDVSVFRNLRFSAASISITFVFFALMGVMYFLTTYLQSVLGYSALEAGVRMAADRGRPDRRLEAVGRADARASGRRSSWPAAWPSSPSRSARSPASTSTPPYFRKVVGALTLMGVGMGLAMAPATEAIMGSLPKAKAGIGSAMNDVVREVGGTLGVAVLGSIVSTSYASGMDDADRRLPDDAAEAASDSVGRRPRGRRRDRRRRRRQAQRPGRPGVRRRDDDRGRPRRGRSLAGALIALAFLPSRARAETAAPQAELPEPAAA